MLGSFSVPAEEPAKRAAFGRPEPVVRHVLRRQVRLPIETALPSTDRIRRSMIDFNLPVRLRPSAAQIRSFRRVLAYGWDGSRTEGPLPVSFGGSFRGGTSQAAIGTGKSTRYQEGHLVTDFKMEAILFDPGIMDDTGILV